MPGCVRPLVALSVELQQSGAANVEAVMRDLLTRATSLLLDAAMFSADPASPAQPSAGLFNGITPLPASAAASRLDAMVEDESLTAALVTLGGGTDICFVAAPPQFEALTIMAGEEFFRRHLVVASAALPAGTLCAIERSALATSVNGMSFDTTDEACVAMTNPGTALIGPTVPGDVAAPISSFWQCGLVCLRLLLDAGWALRGGLIAKVEDAGW